MKNYLTTFTVLFVITYAAAAQNSEFPASWAGHWKGELQWFRTGNPEPRKVNMELHIQPAGDSVQYTWGITYGAATEEHRPYLLLPKDQATGHWQIDEKNGIVLDQFLVGNTFSGAFTVQGNTIVNSYRLENDRLLVEFFSLSAKPLAATGNDTEESPRVDTYRVGSYQRAVLTRVR